MGKTPRIKLNSSRQRNQFYPSEQSVLASISEPDPKVGEKDQEIAIKEALSKSLWKACGLKDPPIDLQEKACLKLIDRDLLVGEYNTTFGELGDQVCYMIVDKNTYSGWLKWSHCFEDYVSELVEGLTEKIEIPVVIQHLNATLDPNFAPRQSSRLHYLYRILDAMPGKMQEEPG